MVPCISTGLSFLNEQVTKKLSNPVVAILDSNLKLIVDWCFSPHAWLIGASFSMFPSSKVAPHILLCALLL